MPASDDPNSLGNILISLRYCTQADVNEALAKMKEALAKLKREQLAETLIGMGAVTTDQVSRAMKLQRMKRRQMSPQEEQEFKHGQRSALISELSEMQTNALAFCDKVNGGGG